MIFFHLPIPWLLGPIFTVLTSQFIVRGNLTWPPILRNTELVIVGIAIGQQFDLSLFNGMGKLIIYMFLINGILLLFSVFFKRFGQTDGLTYGSSVLLQWSLGYSFATSFLSTAPGGLDKWGCLLLQ